MATDPTDIRAAVAFRESAAQSARREREQDDEDVAWLLAAPAGKRLFTRLLRETRVLGTGDPAKREVGLVFMQSAARAAPAVLAEVIVSEARKDQ
jgi:hypothetical protein